MTKLTISRPNTVGVTFSLQRERYAELEEFIERRVERLCDKGWQATELEGSTSNEGCIELTHDNEADVILIQWWTEES